MRSRNYRSLLRTPGRIARYHRRHGTPCRDAGPAARVIRELFTHFTAIDAKRSQFIRRT